MNIEKSFTFPFEDKQWINKLGLGAVITIIPILNFAWTGYLIGLIRNVMNNESEPLPNWDDLGAKFNDGIILFLAGLVYALPMLILICLPVSILVIPAILSGNQNTQDIANIIAGVGSAVMLCLMCVFMIYVLGLSVVYPVIMVLFAREGTFAACFKFREVFDLIAKNTSSFLVAWGVSVGGSLVVSFVIGIAQAVLNFIPCLGWIASLVLSFSLVVYLSLFSTHLFGQFGNMVFNQNQSIPPA